MKLMSKIIRESWKVLIIASILSSIGGLGLKSIQDKLVLLVPLIIVLPALNGMIGNFGIIITAKFTTTLFEGKIKGRLLKTYFVRHLFKEIMPIALVAAIYISLLSCFIAYFKGYGFEWISLGKVLLITLISTITLVLIIFLIAIVYGYHVYKNNEDPDDVLIPITTAIADLGTMVIFSLSVYLIF